MAGHFAAGVLHSLRRGVAFGLCAVQAPIAAQQLRPHRHVPLLPPKQPSSCLKMCMQVRGLQIVVVMPRPRPVASKLFLFSLSSYHSLLSCFA